MKKEFSVKDMFEITYRFLEINYDRCKVLDLTDILSAMAYVDNERPFDIGAIEDFNRAITDFESGKIKMGKYENK